MDERINKLITAFKDNGWRLFGPADISNDWWFKEIIQFNSRFHPVDTELYLTLLTDPQILEKKTIWSIAISLEIPNDRHFTFIDQITLNDIKKTDLNSFVKRINLKVLT